MTANEAREKWLKIAQEHDGIVPFYGCMYGYAGVGEKIISMSVNAICISKTEDCFYYVWGYPGPDYNIYKFSDYGKTWACSIYDFKYDFEEHEDGNWEYWKIKEII